MPTTPPGLPNTLGDIIQKVRRITKSPSPNQITDGQIIQYVNTYFLYDFPQELRLENTLSNFSFTTIPYQESYKLPTDSVITVEPPVYINGYQSFFTQSQDKFYLLYPRLAITASNIAVGNGSTGPYSFTLSNTPLLQNNLVISTVDASGNAQIATDIPVNTATGKLMGDSVAPYIANTQSYIDYISGQGSITFSSIVANGVSINAQLVQYSPSRPVAMLFFQDTFYLRPVPDSAYLVNIQAYINPIACLTGQMYNPPTVGGTTDTNYPSPPNTANVPVGFQVDTETPQLKQWWQLIAWGAAMKVFEDRGDLENIQRFMPLFEKQKRLVLRRTLIEMANERSATIYTEQAQGFGGNFFNQF